MNYLINIIRTKIKTLKENDGILSMSIRGGFWLGLGNGLEQFLRLLRNMILARLLAPEVFGTMAIILAINAFFDSFSGIGIKEAIIQHQDSEKKEYLNIAWWMAAVRGLILYSIAFLCAIPISNFYNDPDLIMLIRIAFLAFIFRGLISPKSYILHKYFQFKKWIVIENLSGIISILATITLAYCIPNVWALIIGFSLQYLLITLISYIVTPFLPSLEFSKECNMELFKYTRKYIGLPILVFIYSKADVFVIGKLLTKYELGLYSMAYSIAMIPNILIMRFIVPLFMPAFSSMKSDYKRISENLLKISTILMCISLPLIVYAILYSSDILTILYTSEYRAVSIPFSIIFSSIIINILCLPFASVFLSIGKPNLQRRFVTIRAIILLLLLYPAVYHFSLIGASVSVLIAILISYTFQLFRLHEIIYFDIIEYLYRFIRILVISLCLFIICLMHKSFFSNNLLITLLYIPVSYIFTVFIGLYSYLDIIYKRQNI